MGQPSHPQRHPLEPASGDRLESWKEIAVYLKKGVRTVQRWEREEDLPVHRHLHEKLGTVYAYKAELDAWWQNGHSRLEQQEHAQPALWPRLRWIAAAMAGVALVVAAWWGVRLVGQPELPFAERDWVLVGGFENRTGEQVFDGVLDYALERELSNSRFVNVVSRPRVEDSLRLMQKPLEARVDLAVGREVCLRDGGIRALLTGRVEKLDSTYLLSASLVEPASGRSVASFSEEAAGQKEVVSALRRLASRIRETLGEKLALIQQSEQKLEKVTTPSLRALYLFSQGSRLKEQGQFKPAEEFLRQAIAEDPDFASAHLWLAFTLDLQQRPREVVLVHAKKAVELSATVTAHERYFIRAGYHWLAREYEKAIAPLEALLGLYPDHFDGVRILSGAYLLVGRPQESIPYRLRYAAMRPNDFRANMMAAGTMIMVANRPEEAEPYVQRARNLLPAEIPESQAGEAVRLASFPAYQAWLAGDLEQVKRIADQQAATLHSLHGLHRGWSAVSTGGLYEMLGKLKRAEELFRLAPNQAVADSNLAGIAELRGDARAFRKHVEGMVRNPKEATWTTVPAFAARAGFVAEAEKALREGGERYGQRPEMKIAQGEVALARGRVAEGIGILQHAVEANRAAGSWQVALALDSLARALDRHGDLPGAVAARQEMSKEKTRLAFVGGASQWIDNQFRLALLYRRMGQVPEARSLEGELRMLLAHADPNHPVLLSLQAAQPGKLSQVKK